MKDALTNYLKGVKKADLKKLENNIDSFVTEPSGQPKRCAVKIRSNPAFHSKARIALEREKRKIETISLGFKTQPPIDCIFCNPKKKAARF